MRLREFLLEGFAQHHRTGLKFRDGEPNLILGPNEAGKSHLMRALIATLFGIRARQADPYIPWHGEPVMRGRLRLSVDCDEIEIDRRFLDERVTVAINGDPVYDGRGLVNLNLPEDHAYRQMLFDWAGVSDAEVFERTVFVGQDLLQDDKLEEMSARLKQIISGSSETSYDAAIRDLEEALGGRDGLRMGPRDRVPRRLENAKGRLTDLLQRLGDAARVQSRVGRLRAEEIEHQQALERAQDEQRMLTGIVEHAGSLATLRRDEERWRERWEELDRQIERMDTIQRQREEQESRARQLAVPGSPDPDDVRRLGAEIGQVERRIADLEAYLERERRRGEMPSTRAPSPEAPPASSRRAGLLGSGVALMGSSLALGVVVHPLFFAGFVPALIFLALGLLQRPTSTTGSPTARDHVGNQAEIAALERQIAEQRDRLRELSGERDRMLGQAGLPDLDALYQRLRQHHEATIRLESIQAVDPEERARLEDGRSQARRETGIARDRIERLLREHPALEHVSPEQLAEYRQRLDVAQQAEREAEGALFRLKIEREELAKGSDDAEALRLEVEEVEAEIARIEDLVEAHDLAIGVLRESVRDFQENALDPVGEDATRHFAAITRGRYSAVRLDKDTMTPSVGIGDIERVDQERLSRGTRDQLYLSIRVALIDALSGGRALPLVLDDPAVNFDAERLSATTDLLREIARDRQVLLLSQDESWARWFDPIIHLPSPR